MGKSIHVLAGILAACLAVGQSDGKAGSQCSKRASLVERALCTDRKLTAEDRLMNQLYSLARVSAFGRGPSNQAAVQHKWLRRRGDCMKAPQSSECLVDAYSARNEELALAVLFSRPELALPELKRLDPEAAPMFEAIYLYARSPHLEAPDRSRIVDLLQHYINTPGGWGEPSSAVKTDSDFADYIGSRSAGLQTDRSGRAFPCAAANRKPKLIEATGPRFGSTMDNFVLWSDCEQTLPPLPKFSALVEKRRSGMGDCGGGTIRFSYYRAFLNASWAARLATSAQLRKKAVKPFPRRRHISNADTSAAVDELAAYYVRYGRSAKAEARPLARQMIYDMLDEAWQC